MFIDSLVPRSQPSILLLAVCMENELIDFILARKLISFFCPLPLYMRSTGFCFLSLPKANFTLNLEQIKWDFTLKFGLCAFFYSCKSAIATKGNIHWLFCPKHGISCVVFNKGNFTMCVIYSLSTYFAMIKPVHDKLCRLLFKNVSLKNSSKVLVIKDLSLPV